MLGAVRAKEEGMVHRTGAQPRHSYLLLPFFLFFESTGCYCCPKQYPLRQLKVISELQGLEGEWLRQNLPCEYGADKVEWTDSCDL